ncbi:MAG: acetate--CoA ligase family protein [Bacteroidetes bacterium]|nr:acetate--CoA ligase family protein [Bacteroidota bacterium]
MINKELIDPKSIVVVGGSNNIQKPGGKVLKNLIDGNFKGDLYVTNPKETIVQGIKCYQSPAELPYVDLAIIAIAAQYVPATVELLAQLKNTKAFIILSAGFSEVEGNEEGKILEKEIVESINNVNGSLIGPNCIGIITPNHNSVFTLPIPKLAVKGCSLISGSGATACFILESGIPKGLTFSSVFSVGNSAQMGVEEILKFMDETYDPENSADIKLLYIENIDKPQMLLKHASSLIRKGCKIAAIKAGSSEAGSRAASSHTGALASSDLAVDALFRKAGIVRCYSREELISVASVFMHKKLKGKNIAIISHAGGPAVMLTDALSKGGLEVPHIKGSAAKQLLEKLNPGSSIGNPIDFLATGTAEQLGTIIDYVNEKFDNIDGMIVIFGTPGLFKIFDVYELLDKKMKTAKKPIYPVLPSTETAKEEVTEFISKGRINFPDEVALGYALAKVFYTPEPAPEKIDLPEVDRKTIRKVIDNTNEGYLSPAGIQELLDAAGISRVSEAVAKTKADAEKFASELGFPVVMKVVGPLHKSDVAGVVLDINDIETAGKEFDRMMKIKDTSAVLIQPMLSGIELFAGAKYEPKFGHLILCGLGGIFIEVLKDVKAGLSPLSLEEARNMIKNLSGYKIIKGIRGQEGVNEEKFTETIIRLSALLEAAPEIVELDINPLLGNMEKVVAVDARIRIKFK